MKSPQAASSKPGRWRRILAALLLVVVTLVLAFTILLLTFGFRAFFPEEVTAHRRLQAFPTGPFPLEHEVSIHWNEYQVPFIEAETDHDLAFSLGLVHGHLRCSQIAVLRRVSQGRLSEMVGPLATSIDKALRTLDLGHAAKESIRRMNSETRSWLQRYVDGLNYYQAHMAEKPPESGLLNLTYEPYTLEELVTLSRLAGADVNWISFFVLLSERQKPSWPTAWKRALATGLSSTPSIREKRSLEELSRLLSGLSRSGSNSVVLRPSMTEGGYGAIVSDPHLGISIPNFWVLVGMKSPSYHAIGMTIPGIPFVAVGRNKHLAWGGTNMRSASSDIVDVTALPCDSFQVRAEEIPVRFWPDEEVSVRWSPYGPVLSDVDLIPADSGEVLALRWTGHDPSDDIGAFLRANRATSLEEFVKAWRGYSVSGQNMLAVDNDGNIVMTLAVRLPERDGVPDHFVLTPDELSPAWDKFLEAPDLPIAVNPSEGYIASANNAPVDCNPPIGYLFGMSERIERLQQILDTASAVDLDWMKNLQQDVYSIASHHMAREWIEQIDSLGLPGVQPELYSTLRDWDGYYRKESRGPVAFETLTYHLLELALPEDAGFRARNWNYVSRYFAADIKSLPEGEKQKIFTQALNRAAEDYERFDSWGAMHVQRAGHILSNIPLIGWLLRWDEYPVGGSRETIMKTNHGFSNRQTSAGYGSQSRHISLMSDLDENYFVLFGGQDGWIGSDNLIDQVALWKEGKYLHLPLRPESIHDQWPYRMTLSPTAVTKLEKIN